MPQVKRQSRRIKKKQGVSEAALRRLSFYHHFLKQLEDEGVNEISSAQIAKCLGFNTIQVRKDIEVTDIKGTPKRGYNLKNLIKHIEKILGFCIKNEAVLVGAGHLGYALLGYQGFKEYGLDIVAAFDDSSDKVNKVMHNRKIFSIEELKDFVRKNRIKIGILTVPAEAAQSLADRMVASGIKAVWNFAPAKINVPDDVIVQHENLASSLAVLSQKLRK